jgi:signal transduction histidine kinase
MSRPRFMRRPPGLRLILGGLAGGAFFLPIALFLVVTLILSLSVPRSSIFHLEYLGEELRKAISVEGSGVIAPRPGYQPPPGFELLIEDSESRILFSTLGRFEVGGSAGLAEVANAVRSDPAISSFFSEIIQLKGKSLGRYYAWFSSGVQPPVRHGAPVGVLVLVGLIALVFTVGGIIATQLARAVLRLESAAGRIAAGDFDTAVGVRGIREIEDLARAMDGMRATLREGRDLRARFLAAISHDLRTPLTSIGGYLEAVEDGLAADPETLGRYVRIMRGKTRLLEARIGGLIDFARMETEEWRMGFEAVELRSFLENFAREAREDAALLGRRFEARLDGLASRKLPIDRGLLSRAFENIISNALRFTAEGGLVRLSARASGDSLVLDIDDEGPGIATSERERVFEPFYRGSGAREGEGSGLGLYIARSIVRGHGWELEAGEAARGGGRISIRIPGDAEGTAGKGSGQA